MNSKSVTVIRLCSVQIDEEKYLFARHRKLLLALHNTQIYKKFASSYEQIEVEAKILCIENELQCIERSIKSLCNRKTYHLTKISAEKWKN